MIVELTDILDSFILSINFICNVVICSSCFYFVMHNISFINGRRLYDRQLCKTAIWYCGVSSFFVSLTILLQWIFGNKFPLSYDNLGILGEVGININLAILGFLSFYSIFKHNEEVKANSTPLKSQRRKPATKKK